MGFTPRQVDDMSLWQFRAVLDGWNEAHAADAGDGLGADDIATLSAALDAAS